MTRVYLILYISSLNLGSNSKMPRKCVVQGSVLGLVLARMEIRAAVRPEEDVGSHHALDNDTSILVEISLGRKSSE
jgi:hypothetical protein